MRKDFSGDGVLGGKSGGHYRLNHRQDSYLLPHIIFWLFIGIVTGLVITIILLLLNNKLGITALQTVIAGN